MAKQTKRPGVGTAGALKKTSTTDAEAITQADIKVNARRAEQLDARKRELALETYDLARLPADHPRRRPTLARVRFLDGGDR